MDNTIADMGCCLNDDKPTTRGIQVAVDKYAMVQPALKLSADPLAVVKLPNGAFELLNVNYYSAIWKKLFEKRQACRPLDCQYLGHKVIFYSFSKLCMHKLSLYWIQKSFLLPEKSNLINFNLLVSLDRSLNLFLKSLTAIISIITCKSYTKGVYIGSYFNLPACFQAHVVIWFLFQFDQFDQ